MPSDLDIAGELRSATRLATSLVDVPDLWPTVERRIRQRARSRRLVRLTVAAVLVVVVGTALVLARDDYRILSKRSTQAETQQVQPVSRQTWASMAPPPIFPRTRSTVVWTGTDVIELGGFRATGEAATDGAAFDVATSTWREIAAPPAAALGATVSVWTGQAVVAFGGVTADGVVDTASSLTTGALYDPVADSWETIATTDLGRVSSAGSYAVWTGHQVLVAGFQRPPVVGEESPDAPKGSEGAALYDPARDRWTTLPAAPEPLPPSGDAFWTGREMVVVGVDPATGPEPRDHVVALAFDPAASVWRSLPTPPLDPRPGMLAAWTGDEVVLGGGASATDPTSGAPVHVDAVAYDPTTDAWRRLPDAPVPFGGSTRYADVILGGKVAAYVTADPTARPLLFSPKRNVWAFGPVGRSRGDTTRPDLPVVSTGDQILLWV